MTILASNFGATDKYEEMLYDLGAAISTDGEMIRDAKAKGLS